jgi:N-acetylneuraminate synthase
MTLDIDRAEFRVSSDHPLWGGKKLIDLYRQTQTPYSWHKEMFECAIANGITPFSTPFDLNSVDFLEDLGCTLYKVASLESSDLNLIKYIASTKKPIIISTGATTFDEVADAVEACHSVGNSKITLLVCTSSYPANPEDANLGRLGLLKKTFGTEVGLSDHTLSNGVAIAAIALGASVIEKHFTISRNDGGPDSAFSIEPGELKTLVSQGTDAWLSIGHETWTTADSERESRRLRRSLYVTKNVAAGDVLSPTNIAAVRPGFGISPKYIEFVLGKKFSDNFSAGTPVNFEMLEE